MKNFDVERKHRHTPVEDRTFVLGGETFVAKEDVHPSVLVAFDRIDGANFETLFEVIDGMIVDLIEPDNDSADRYRRIRENTDDPITIETMTSVSNWLVEVMTGRPTGQPSGSAPGRPQTGTPSTGVSSLPVTPTASAA